ncbi:hypothetical protein [Thioalkalivibrio sulfidiphilus]|uniref:hypothetical protein n=1 Tax=Thioalkalivibrio sulfidiphilus TaxID=1033854 RepID=UPI00035E8810|nr:hypothetical protein [Thioalkalivibrio sulfidiphilus]
MHTATPFTILHQDDDLVAINKPEQMLVHRSPISRDVARYSLVQITPDTGRRHQIRRHFKHIFHPLAGDTTYGEGRHNRLFREHFGVERLLLHASHLSLRHPTTGEALNLHAPLPESFSALLQRLGWEAFAHGIQFNIQDSIFKGNSVPH